MNKCTDLNEIAPGHETDYWYSLQVSQVAMQDADEEDSLVPEYQDERVNTIEDIRSIMYFMTGDGRCAW